MSKIGILYICTGKYDIFWKDFYESCEKYFMTNHEKIYFVFTDAEKLYGENKNIKIIYQENLGWPDNTLMRYHLFLKEKTQLEKLDYLYFFNANSLFLKPVNEEFLPDPFDLVVVKHPGYYKTTRYLYPYERRKKSTSYIPYGKGKYYICGGINGGKSGAFLSLIDTMVKNIDEDRKNNIIPKWHDESVLNHYIVNYNNYKILSPSYCYPEDFTIDFDPIIQIRDKSKYIDVNTIKNKSLYAKMKTRIRKLLKKLGVL